MLIFQFDPFLPIPVVLYMLRLQCPNFAACHFTVQLQHFDSNRWSKTGPKRILRIRVFFATESLRFDKIDLCFLKPLLLWLVSRFFFPDGEDDCLPWWELKKMCYLATGNFDILFSSMESSSQSRSPKLTTKLLGRLRGDLGRLQQDGGQGDVV